MEYPKLYKILGSNKLPNLQVMFLRGYGSQKYNGKALSSGETGKIQGWGSPKFHLLSQYYSCEESSKYITLDFKYMPVYDGNVYFVFDANAPEKILSFYKYGIGSTSPCNGITSLTEECLGSLVLKYT